MLITGQRNYRVIFGESVAEVSQWLAATPRVWSLASSEQDDRGWDWDMNANLSGALKLAAEGWDEGATRMEASLRALPAPNTSHVETRMDVAGHYPDVAAYLAGRPDCMATRGKAKGHEPVVHIVMDNRLQAGVPAREQENYGLAMAAVIDKLEASGRRVELDVLFTTQGGSGQIVNVVGWKVKQAAEHLDISALAFSLAHPAAFRRLGFAMMERQPKNAENHGYGSGHGLDATIASLLGTEHALLINGINDAHGLCATPQSAVLFATAQINRAAGEDIVVHD